MFHFNNSLLVCPSLFILVASVACCNGLVAIGWRVRVEHPDIKVCALPIAPPKPLSFDIESQLSSMLAVLCRNVSPVSGWRGGSTSTLGQTSESSWAVISLIQSCRIEGKAPFAQLEAWVVVNCVPHEQWLGSLVGSHP